MDGENQFGIPAGSVKNDIRQKQDVGSADQLIYMRPAQIPKGEIKKFIGNFETFYLDIGKFMEDRKIKPRPLPGI